MSAQRGGERDPQEERTKRQQRAERILDAAAELIQRWGYNKTTIDDIARRAGVAKGTIYLHWKTREDLFYALLLREDLKLAEDTRQRMASDPEGGTLHGMLKHATLATMQNPLWKALFLRDTNILGDLARKEYGTTTAEERISTFTGILQYMRDAGIIRSDQSIKAQFHLFSAITTGFLMVEPFLSEEIRLSDEEAVEVMADALQRAFEPREPAPISEEHIEAVTQVINRYMDKGIAIIQEQEQKEIQ